MLKWYIFVYLIVMEIVDGKNNIQPNANGPFLKTQNVQKIVVTTVKPSFVLCPLIVAATVHHDLFSSKSEVTMFECEGRVLSQLKLTLAIFVSKVYQYPICMHHADISSC